MADFLSTFVFILPGIMAYFWLQVFGLNPSVKHTAPEISGIAALLWLPVSFITLLILNTWGFFINISIFSVDEVWTVDALNKATSDIKYLVLFLFVSFIVSFFICWLWSLFGNKFLHMSINQVRKTRNIAPLSSSTSVWEEFFIKIEDQKINDRKKGKEAVYKVYKIDKKDDCIFGSMTKASRPLESDKALVLEDTEQWKEYLKDNTYEIKKVYIDTKSGMVVEEIDHKSLLNEGTIPDD